jgi:hypothetical protein
MIVLEEIRKSVAGVLGAPFNTNPNLINFVTIKSGSV